MIKDDLEQLAAIVKDTNIFIVSDEVYEHIIFDGHNHQEYPKQWRIRIKLQICP